MEEARLTLHGMWVRKVLWVTETNKTYVILSQPNKNTDFVIEAINVDMTSSKRQPKELWDTCFDTLQDAYLAVENYEKGRINATTRKKQ